MSTVHGAHKRGAVGGCAYGGGAGRPDCVPKIEARRSKRRRYRTLYVSGYLSEDVSIATTQRYAPTASFSTCTSRTGRTRGLNIDEEDDFVLLLFECHHRYHLKLTPFPPSTPSFVTHRRAFVSHGLLACSLMLSARRCLLSSAASLAARSAGGGLASLPLRPPSSLHDAAPQLRAVWRAALSCQPAPAFFVAASRRLSTAAAAASNKPPPRKESKKGLGLRRRKPPNRLELAERDARSGPGADEERPPVRSLRRGHIPPTISRRRVG